MPYTSAACCGMMAAAYLTLMSEGHWGGAAWCIFWGLLMAWASDRDLNLSRSKETASSEQGSMP